MAQVQQAHSLHRRQVTLRVILPVALAGIVLVSIPLVIVIRAPQSIGTVASFLAAFFLLLPMVVLCIVPYALLLVLIAGMAIVNRRASAFLDVVLGYSYQINALVRRGSKIVASPVIAANKQVAWLEQVATDVMDGRNLNEQK
jgi:hypothetical protein